ncbi:hypothetical protein HPB51_025501 [Rhipicephalus microplus]|uniref:Uncharacterized protein n=1 Tax=Rhipicephalus microplus TaxID=6941 RepID=A0A9J6DDQ4_RHIMP|nr:hypothetical protein HPB51_025501 [Rhipicephalus microplus]
MWLKHELSREQLGSSERQQNLPARFDGPPHQGGPPQSGGPPSQSGGPSPHLGHFGGPPHSGGPPHRSGPPPPPPHMGPPPPAHAENAPSGQGNKFNLGSSSVRLQLNREYYRTPPGLLGIVEVLCSCAIVTTLSLRGFVFDVFFFLCNLGFTYALVGVMFFVNGLVGSRAGRDLPLLVAVQYYGLGFVMFLAAGIASLARSQRELVAIMVGTMSVVVAIALLVHAVHSVRSS